MISFSFSAVLIQVTHFNVISHSYPGTTEFPVCIFNWNSPWSWTYAAESHTHTHLTSCDLKFEDGCDDSCRMCSLLALKSNLCLLYTVLSNFYLWTCCFCVCMCTIPHIELLPTVLLALANNGLLDQNRVLRLVELELCQLRSEVDSSSDFWAPILLVKSNANWFEPNRSEFSASPFIF